MCAILPGILWIFIINMELKCIHSERILAADSESPMSDRKPLRQDSGLCFVCAICFSACRALRLYSVEIFTTMSSLDWYNFIFQESKVLCLVPEKYPKSWNSSFQ